MLGYIQACWIPPWGSRSPERPAICHMRATASSTQSPERVFIPKILCWPHRSRRSLTKPSSQALAAALPPVADFTIKMLDRRRTGIL
jgi:hypothetical protein